MVAMLSCAGTMDQLGLRHTRVWGDIQDPKVLARVMTYVQAAGAVAKLRGETYGLFGGRPLGMYTAVANLDQWQIAVRRGRGARRAVRHRALPRRRWTRRAWRPRCAGWSGTSAQIRYDGKALTPEKLKRQIRSYHAVRQLMVEKELDFVGFKAHGDLTEYFATMDVAEAFLNDPYDWEGPHEPIVAATEADMDGALTMEIFKHLSGADLALRRHPALRRGGRRLVLRQLRYARHLLRRPVARPGRRT